MDEKRKRSAKATLGLLTTLAASFDPDFSEKMDRIMDGLCPDCGQPANTHENNYRCYVTLPDPDPQHGR